jgi:hypothetical protein
VRGGNKKTAPRLRDGLTDITVASIQRPPGVGKVKIIPRLCCVAELKVLFHLLMHQ